MSKFDTSGLKRRVGDAANHIGTGATHLARDGGLFIGAIAPTESGSRVLGVPARTIAVAGHKTAMGGIAVSFGALVVESMTASPLIASVGAASTAALVGGVGASLVASAPSTPAHPDRPLRIRNQSLRRTMIGSGAIVAAANWAAVGLGTGVHPTAVGVGALAVAAAGYVSGL